MQHLIQQKKKIQCFVVAKLIVIQYFHLITIQNLDSIVEVYSLDIMLMINLYSIKKL